MARYDELRTSIAPGLSMPKQKRVMRWARPESFVGTKTDLKPNPGDKFCIANQGEVRLHFPAPGVINFRDDSIRITDMELPDDD